jgi:hypothetical protein
VESAVVAVASLCDLAIFECVHALKAAQRPPGARRAPRRPPGARPAGLQPGARRAPRRPRVPAQARAGCQVQLGLGLLLGLEPQFGGPNQLPTWHEND